LWGFCMALPVREQPIKAFVGSNGATSRIVILFCYFPEMADDGTGAIVARSPAAISDGSESPHDAVREYVVLQMGGCIQAWIVSTILAAARPSP